MLQIKLFFFVLSIIYGLKFVVDFIQNNMGLKVCMITGDNKYSALKVAKHLRIN